MYFIHAFKNILSHAAENWMKIKIHFGSDGILGYALVHSVTFSKLSFMDFYLYIIVLFYYAYCPIIYIINIPKWNLFRTFNFSE